MAGRASIVGAAATHVGRVREHNEDAHVVDVDTGVFLVCDGMGGHAAGEVASELAIQAIRREWSSQALQDAANRWLERGTPEAKKQLLGVIRAGVVAAHTSIITEAERDESKSGMGTTLVGAVIVGGELVFAHAGDSRAYLVRDGISMQLTEDHTLLARLLAAGIEVDVSGEGARFRSMLTNALGIGEEVKVSTFVVPLADGDRFLLCSDGVSEYVPENEVGEVLTKQPSPARAAQRLIDLALERGGGDNATAVVVRVLEAGETPLPAEQRKKDDAAISACALWGKRVTPQQRLRALRIAIPRDHNFGEKLPPHALGDRVAWIILEGELVQDGEPLGPGALIYPESLLGARETLPPPGRDSLAITRSDVRALAFRANDFRELCDDDSELGEALLDSLAAMIARRKVRVPAREAGPAIDPRGNTDPQLPVVPRDEPAEAAAPPAEPDSSGFDEPTVRDARDAGDGRDRASRAPDAPTQPLRRRSVEAASTSPSPSQPLPVPQPSARPSTLPPATGKRTTPPPPPAAPSRPSPLPGPLAARPAAQPLARPSPLPEQLTARPAPPPSPQQPGRPSRPTPPPEQSAAPPPSSSRPGPSEQPTGRTQPPPPPQPNRPNRPSQPPEQHAAKPQPPNRPSPPPEPHAPRTQPPPPPQPNRSNRPSPPPDELVARLPPPPNRIEPPPEPRAARPSQPPPEPRAARPSQPPPEPRAARPSEPPPEPVVTRSPAPAQVATSPPGPPHAVSSPPTGRAATQPHSSVPAPHPLTPAHGVPKPPAAGQPQRKTLVRGTTSLRGEPPVKAVPAPAATPPHGRELPAQARPAAPAATAPAANKMSSALAEAAWDGPAPRVRGDSPWDAAEGSEQARDDIGKAMPKGFAPALAPPPGGPRRRVSTPVPVRSSAPALHPPTDPEIETYLEMEADLPPEHGDDSGLESELALSMARDAFDDDHESVSITIEQEGQRVTETTTETSAHTLTVTVTESAGDTGERFPRALTAEDGAEVSGSISIPEDTPPPPAPRRRARRQSDGWDD